MHHTHHAPARSLPPRARAAAWCGPAARSPPAVRPACSLGRTASSACACGGRMGVEGRAKRGPFTPSLWDVGRNVANARPVLAMVQVSNALQPLEQLLALMPPAMACQRREQDAIRPIAPPEVVVPCDARQNRRARGAARGSAPQASRPGQHGGRGARREGAALRHPFDGDANAARGMRHAETPAPTSAPTNHTKPVLLPQGPQTLSGPQGSHDPASLLTDTGRRK
jgi:hypothetical protein